MGIEKTSSGTRGTNAAVIARLLRPLQRIMMGMHRRSGNTFQGMDVLYLETIGAKSGEKRQTPLAYFPDGDADSAWFVAASLGGSAANPAWYHNLVAHPDQVRVEIDDTMYQVVPEQLSGERREKAWQQIVASQPRYGKYQGKTDRIIPVIRLERVG